MTPALKCRRASCPLCASSGHYFTLTGVVVANAGQWFIKGVWHGTKASGETTTSPDTYPIAYGAVIELLHCDGWREGMVDHEGNLLFPGASYDKLEFGTELIPLEALARTGRTVRVIV